MAASRTRICSGHCCAESSHGDREYNIESCVCCLTFRNEGPPGAVLRPLLPEFEDRRMRAAVIQLNSQLTASACPRTLSLPDVIVLIGTGRIAQATAAGSNCLFDVGLRR